MVITILGTNKKYSPSCLIDNILFDVGKDTVSRLSSEQLDFLNSVLITHGHRENIDGIPKLNKVLDKRTELINLYASTYVIKQIRLRWGAKDVGNFNIIEINSNQCYEIDGHKIKAEYVEHDKDYTTFSYIVDNRIVYAPNCSSTLKSQYFKDNDLLIIDGSYCGSDIKKKNHINIATDIDKIGKLNNHKTLFMYPKGSYESEYCINKFLSNYNMRLAIENEVIHMTCTRNKIINVHPLSVSCTKAARPNVNPDFNKEYKLSKILPTLKYSHTLYVIEPALTGKSSITVDKKRKIIYERVIHDSKEVITDILAHKNSDLTDSTLLTRLIYLDKNWNRLMVPKYTPRRIISTKDDLAYNIKRLKKYGNLIIRPLTSKYYDGKFILHNKVEQEKGRTTKDREHYHRYVIDSEGTGKTVKYIGKRYKHTHDIKEGEVLSYSNHNHELISDLNKRIVFKPAPDVTENYIRWRIRNPNLFVDGSFRTIIISKRQKIKAVVGKFKSDPNGSTHVQTVLFDRKKWTVAKARKWIKEHSNSLKSIAKEDDLGQLDSPSGDDMPRPVTSLKTYRCKECDFEFQSNKKETECPICKGKVVLVNNNKSEDVTMRKDIDLPRDNSIPSLKEKMIQKVIGVGVFKQTQITKSIPFFKLAMYSKAIQEVVKSTDNEVKIIDLQWGEKYIPASYEFLETKRDISERLMISGYILAKGDKPFVIHFYPGYNVQHMNIIGKRQDQEFLNKLLTDVDTYVHKNNPWKGEQVTPFGRFLKKEDITLDKVIIAKEVKQRLEKTIFSFFDSKDKYIKADIPFKRGAIFSGVPGTGKTLSGKVIMNTVSGNAYNCECLKCGHKLSSNSHCRDIKCPECGGDMRRADRPGIGKSNTPKDNQKEGVTFIWVTAKDFASVGTGQLFDMARELQPAVLFIEDVDRCLTGSTVDTIKTEMDGMESNNGILTILSTNFPNQLPKTLIDRPGRFDDIIEFELPDSVLRFKILWMYSKKIDIVNKKEALAEISRITKGLTPAHLKEIVVSSYMNCKNDRVTIEDLKKNTDRVTDLHSRFNFNSGKYQKNCYSSLYKKIIESAKRQKKAKSTI